MDKQEYKIKSEEIKSLIAKRDFFNAVKIADEIDWSRVRSVAMLCTISDLYKANRRYKESKELLLMAYERHPNGRMILYSLCELCLKMGEVVQAIEYYKAFVQLAPMDNGKFVLQYKLYVAQEVSLEERIAVLEELKRRDYREKWGYELAYLYHRIGLATKCVEECDELILWFSDGRYVKKAMELKMLHQPLSPSQEASYNSFIGKEARLPQAEPEEVKPLEEQIKEPSVSIGQYNTINLQKALAESMKEVLSPVVSDPAEEKQEETQGLGEITSQIMAPMFENTSDMKEIFFEDHTGEMSLPAAQILQESHLVEEPEEMVHESHPVEKPEEMVHESHPVEKSEEMVHESHPVEKPEEIVQESHPVIEPEEIREAAVPAMAQGRMVKQKEVPDDATKEIPSIREIMEQTLTPPSMASAEPTVQQEAKEKPLSKEDGWQNLAENMEQTMEKPVTGKMNIDEVLEEWERTKKEYEEKSKADLARRVQEQTGSMFTEFEARMRDSILETLQQEEQQVAQTAKAAENAQEMSFDHGKKEIEAAPAEEEKPDAVSLENTADLEKLIQEEKVSAEEEKSEKQETLEKLQQAKEEIRELSEEEKALFAPFIQTRGAKRRFLKALDLISLAPYTGNVIVTGEADSDTMKLAKNIMKDIQMIDANFSGVIAKVSGVSLNSKSIEGTIAKLNNGGLIIEKASEMNSQAVMKLLKALNQEKTGIVVILEDTKKAMKRMLAAYPDMSTFFNAHIEVEELNNDALAAYGRQYAAHMEYSIDELGMLALQTEIENRQSSDHIVTVAEVRELVDDAIAHANRKTVGHLFDAITGKRYDEEDMIILREKDFM